MVPSHIYNMDLYSWKGPHVPCYEVQLLLSPAISTFHRTAAACIRPNGQNSAKNKCKHQFKILPGSKHGLSSILCHILMIYQLSKYFC